MRSILERLLSCIYKGAEVFVEFNTCGSFKFSISYDKWETKSFIERDVYIFGNWLHIVISQHITKVNTNYESTGEKGTKEHSTNT